jgi:hypothetical protein
MNSSNLEAAKMKAIQSAEQGKMMLNMLRRHKIQEMEEKAIEILRGQGLCDDSIQKVLSDPSTRKEIEDIINRDLVQDDTTSMNRNRNENQFEMDCTGFEKWQIEGSNAVCKPGTASWDTNTNENGNTGSNTGTNDTTGKMDIETETNERINLPTIPVPGIIKKITEIPRILIDNQENIEKLIRGGVTMAKIVFDGISFISEAMGRTGRNITNDEVLK